MVPLNGLLISKIDFFSGLDHKILTKLGDACVMRRFTRNETIVRQGEVGLGLYLIAKGAVKVDREQDGVGLQVVELGPEQFFGEMSLLDNQPHAATVTCLEDSECALLTRDSFVRLMNKHPEIPIRMARVMADRLLVANEKLAAGPPPAPPAAAPAQGPQQPNEMKARILGELLGIFRTLYTLKALSRFSVALLGCPVEGTAANTLDQIRAGDVKALFFRANEPVDMRIATLEPGLFTLDVFTPCRAAPCHFGPLALDPGDCVHMTMLAGEINLYYDKHVISSH
jgi:CRP-like cAMP-binding protein